MIDQKEKLFSDYKESHQQLEDIRTRIRDHSTLMEELHKEAGECEREYNFLRRVLHLTIAEDMDPILAKFKVSEEFKSSPDENVIKSSLAYTITSVDDDRYVKRSKLRRMIRAIREIWNERY